MIPFAGSSGDLILPSASLLIRKQIVCIDDIERSGDGLKIEELLGFISFLKEQRNCKIVLLLNRDGLAEKDKIFTQYLEKVVDQSVTFQPTPSESVALALDQNDDLALALGQICEKLGIVNIRVIRRIWRFVCHIREGLLPFEDGVLLQAVQTLAVFGWSIFESEYAPSLEYVKSYSRFAGLFNNSEGPNEIEARWNAILDSSGFAGVDDFDNVLIDGLIAGSFDMDSLCKEAIVLNKQYVNSEVRHGIHKPWDMLGDSLQDDEEKIVSALIESVDNFAQAMSVSDINSVVVMLRDLEKPADAEQCLEKFLAANVDKPRSFFQMSSHHPIRQRIDPALAVSFEHELSARPIERNPAEVLVNIERNSGWGGDDIKFLSTLPEEKLFEIIKTATGDDLHDMIRSATRFVNTHEGPSEHVELGAKMLNVLRRISAESRLNNFRLRSYLPSELTDVENEPHQEE